MSVQRLKEAKERASRVAAWADLHGDDLAGTLRLDPEFDSETLLVLEDALWCVHDVLELVPDPPEAS